MHNYNFMCLENDKIKKIKHDCKCGVKYSENNLKSHMKTKNHKQYELQEAIEIITKYNIKEFKN